MLTYDVPEEHRPYRDTLRAFLTRMRMGCLQRSVWVTPQDIRPQYSDLAEAGGVLEYSFMFESMTVLGRSAEDVVVSAWDCDLLRQAHSWYCDVYAENMQRVHSGKAPAEQLMTLAREEMSAYLSVMSMDPLLPRQLWPVPYRGEEVYELHKRIAREIGRQL